MDSWKKKRKKGKDYFCLSYFSFASNRWRDVPLIPVLHTHRKDDALESKYILIWTKDESNLYNFFLLLSSLYQCNMWWRAASQRGQELEQLSLMALHVQLWQRDFCYLKGTCPGRAPVVVCVVFANRTQDDGGSWMRHNPARSLEDKNF